MTSWKTYRLGDIAKFQTGKLNSNAAVENGKYPFFTCSPNTLAIDNYAFDKEAILLAGNNAEGNFSIKYYKGKFNAYQRTYIIETYNDICDIKFLFYALKLCLQQFKLMSQGTSTKFLTAVILNNFEISLPPLEEQRRIAGILGAIDDKIENNRRINDNLEQQAQALYKQWFVDFEFPNEEGEPYKSSGGKMVDSELGPIPDGWRVGKLEDIGDIIGGGTPSKAVAEYYTKNGIAWITPKDLSVSHLKFTAKGETDITELGYNNSSAKIMPRGSVLFSSRAPIGYISIAKNDICTNQGFKSVVPNNGCTAFVYYFLLSNTENIESKATGSTFKEASGALMKSLELVIPSNDILEKFEKIMSPIFESQEKFEAENETLATLRDTLLPKLMNGEIKL
jgi:type I restriction enzyme S subunit